MTKEKDREIKPVVFSFKSEHDTKLLKFVSSNGMAFSTYIKTLIEKDMNNSLASNSDSNLIAEAINKLTNVIANTGLKIESNTIEEIVENEEVDNETKSMINSFMKL